jgi:hypothetical protein
MVLPLTRKFNPKPLSKDAGMLVAMAIFFLVPPWLVVFSTCYIQLAKASGSLRSIPLLSGAIAVNGRLVNSRG